MKIKLVKTTKYKELSIGKVYEVLSIDFLFFESCGYQINYRILFDDATIALIAAEFFEIVDEKIDVDFVAKHSIPPSFSMMPTSFNYGSFWENFYDREEHALKIFKDRFPNLETIYY